MHQISVFVSRPPTLHGVPRENRMLHTSYMETCSYQRNMFVLDSESKPLDLPSSNQDLALDLATTQGLKDALEEAPKETCDEASKEAFAETPKTTTS